MVTLSKSMLAATARRNAPPRLGDVEPYTFGKYDADLSDLLVSDNVTTSNIARKFSMYKNGLRPVSVNYSSDGLTYYITRQHHGLTGSTTSTSYDTFEVMHLTLSRAHDLRTVTSSQNYVVNMSDAGSVVGDEFSRNTATKVNWHNGGYNLTFIGKNSGSATSVVYTAYACSVTTPYTGEGLTLIDSIHDPIFEFDSEILFNTDGTKGLVFSPQDYAYGFENGLASDPWKLGDGNRDCQFPHPNRCTYWNKLDYLSVVNDNATPGRIFAHEFNSSTAYVFYPGKTSTSTLNYQSFVLKRHTTNIFSNQINYMKQDITTDDYQVGSLLYSATSNGYAPYDVRDYTWSADGLKFYLISRSGYSTNNPYYVYGFDVSTAFDLDTLTGTYQTIPSAGLTDRWDDICAMCFNNRATYQNSSSASTDPIGTVLYVISLSATLAYRQVHIFDLSTAWDVSTATFRESISTIFNGVDISSAGEVTKAQYTSVAMHHPVLNQNGTTRPAESIIVYPYVSNTSGQQTPYVIYNTGNLWFHQEKTDLKEQLKTDAGQPGNGFQLDFALSERLHGFSAADATQIGEQEYETQYTRTQIRRDGYYRRLHKAAISYADNSNQLTADNVETGTALLQNATNTRRGGTTGSTYANWIDSKMVGSARKFAYFSHGSGSNKYGMVWILFQEYVDNKNEVGNGGLGCVNRVRLGGVKDWDMSQLPQIASATGSNVMQAGPITEIFQTWYSDWWTKIAAMWPVPLVPASGNDPEIPARMGFMDDRGYVYYLESSSMYAANGQSWPLPFSANHPGGILAGSAMGNAMKYTKTENTVSAHEILQDNVTIYNQYQYNQKITDFAFDATGHVCVVAINVFATSSSETNAVFVYYVDKPFSTNKDDWTYIVSGTGGGYDANHIFIVDGRVGASNFGNDTVTINVQVDEILQNGPTYAHPALTFTSYAHSGTCDGLWIDNKRESGNSSTHYYEAIRTDTIGSSIRIYHGLYRYLDQGATQSWSWYTSRGNVYYLDDNLAQRELIASAYSDNTIWYDRTHETFYFINEYGSSGNSDSVFRNPLQLLKAKVIDKDYNGTGHWIIETPVKYELKGQVPTQPRRIKIYRDRLYFVEMQERFIGSTRMR